MYLILWMFTDRVRNLIQFPQLNQLKITCLSPAMSAEYVHHAYLFYYYHAKSGRLCEWMVLSGVGERLTFRSVLTVIQVESLFNVE